MSDYGKSAEKKISTVDRMTAAWGFSAVGPMIQIDTMPQMYLIMLRGIKNYWLFNNIFVLH